MEEPLNGWQALSAVFKDSIVEVLGIVCAGALALMECYNDNKVTQSQ